MSLSCVTKKEFIFTWRIENSLFTVDACLESPTFLAQNLLNTKWSLKLIVKIINGIHQLFCILKRDYEDEGPTAVGIHFKIHLDKKYYPCDCIFSRGTSESVILFPIMEFLRKGGQKGPWTIQCILWMWDDEPQPSSVQCIAETRIQITKFSDTKEFSWIATKKTEDMEVNLKLNSTVEKVFPVALKLDILVRNNVTIKIRSFTARNVFLSGRISVKNDNGDFLYSAHDSFFFSDDGNSWEFPFVFSRERAKRILGSEVEINSLSLVFEFFIPGGFESSDIEYSSNKAIKGPVRVYVHRRFKSKFAESQATDLIYLPNSASKKDLAALTVSADCSRILDELHLETERRLQAKEHQYRRRNSDIEQYCLDVFGFNFFFLQNRKLFLILLVIVLCLSLAFGYYFTSNNSSDIQKQPSEFNSRIYVKSDAFNAIFQVDITETESDNQNIIADLDSKTLDNFLGFVFSEELETLHWKKVIKLLHVAYEYNIIVLEDQCISFLQSRMSASNVCEILLFAHSNYDVDLKRSAQDFIRLHANEVFATNEWKDFMLRNSKLAAETVQYFSWFN